MVLWESNQSNVSINASVIGSPVNIYANKKPQQIKNKASKLI